VDEVPLLEPSLLTLDEQDALAGEHEEVLLLRLPVVEAVRLAGWQDVDPDADLCELGRRSLERALRAGGAQLSAFRGQPFGVGDVDDEPARSGRRQPRTAVLERRLGHAASLVTRRLHSRG
jgi:hypothetical protein